jgi:hypothetical protein
MASLLSANPIMESNMLDELRRLAESYGYLPEPILVRCVWLGRSTAASVESWAEQARDLLIRAHARGDGPDAWAIVRQLQPTPMQRNLSVDVQIDLPEIDLDAPAEPDEWVGIVSHVAGGTICVPLEFWCGTQGLQLTILPAPGHDEPIEYAVAAAFADAFQAIAGFSAFASDAQITVRAHPSLGLRPLPPTMGADIAWTNTVRGRAPSKLTTRVNGVEFEVPEPAAAPEAADAPEAVDEKVPQRSLGLLALSARGRLYQGTRSIPRWLRDEALALVSIHGFKVDQIRRHLARLLEVEDPYVSGYGYPLTRLAFRMVRRAKRDRVYDHKYNLRHPDHWQRSASWPWPSASRMGCPKRGRP